MPEMLIDIFALWCSETDITGNQNITACAIAITITLSVYVSVTPTTVYFKLLTVNILFSFKFQMSLSNKAPFRLQYRFSIAIGKEPRRYPTLLTGQFKPHSSTLWLLIGQFKPHPSTPWLLIGQFKSLPSTPLRLTEFMSGSWSRIYSLVNLCLTM